MEVWLEMSYDKVQITSSKSVNPLVPGGNKGNSFLKVIHHEKVGGGRGHFDPPCDFSQNVSSKERVKPFDVSISSPSTKFK